MIYIYDGGYPERDRGGEEEEEGLLQQFYKVRMFRKMRLNFCYGRKEGRSWILDPDACMCDASRPSEVESRPKPPFPPL